MFILITVQPLTAHLLFFTPPRAAFQPPSCHESFLSLVLLPSPSRATYASNTDRGVNLPAVIKTASFVVHLPSSSSRPWWHNGVKSTSNGQALGRTQVCNTISCRVGKKQNPYTQAISRCDTNSLCCIWMCAKALLNWPIWVCEVTWQYWRPSCLSRSTFLRER